MKYLYKTSFLEKILTICYTFNSFFLLSEGVFTLSNEKNSVDKPAFSTLVHSISVSALSAMGVVPSMKDKKNRKMAAFNIDLLVLLKEKTKSNLTNEEQILLDDSIRDLQIAFSQMKEDAPTTN